MSTVEEVTVYILIIPKQTGLLSRKGNQQVRIVTLEKLR